ncbi:MAG TPA: hypothetical protein VF507_03610 [Pyrinomonadaceae bacterium]
MKKVILLLLSLALLVCTMVPDLSAQTRRRSRFGRKSRTAAIIGGGALAGAALGGKKGAAIGAGAGTLYAANRPAARRHFRQRNRRLATVAGGTALGAGVGAAAGGKKGAVVGGLVGAGGSYVYTRNSRHYRRRY